jgi:hypothetical protein
MRSMSRTLLVMIALAVAASPEMSLVCELRCHKAPVRDDGGASCHQQSGSPEANASLTATNHGCAHAVLMPTPSNALTARQTSRASALVAFVSVWEGAIATLVAPSAHGPPGILPPPHALRPSVLRI